MLFLASWIIVACMVLVFYKKWLLCILLLFYIWFIDWFFTCLDLSAGIFLLNYCSWYVIGSFTRSHYFVWLWNDYYFISRSLIDFFLLWSVCYFYHLNYSKWYIVACYYEKWFHCMVVNSSLSFISFIDSLLA